MRYAIFAAISAALLSTSAFAQDASSTTKPQNHRAYAPVAAPATPATTAFPSQQIDRKHESSPSLSQEDRLFLMQGDRGLGNG